MGKTTDSWRRGIAGLLLVASLISGCKQGAGDAKSSARESIAQALKQTSKALASVARDDLSIVLSFCLINYNGDDVLDVVGMTATTINGPAVILDGRTGATLWSGGDYHGGSQVICPSPDFFVVNDYNGWDLSIRRATNPNSEKIARLSDKPEAYGFGSDCLAVQTADKQMHGIRLRDGAREPCVAPSMKTLPELFFDRGRLVDSDPWRAQSGRSEYEIAVRSPGTPVLTAKSSGEFAWTRELPYEGRAPSGVVTEDMLLLTGKRVSSQSSGIVLIALDRRTGAVRYEQPLCARNLKVSSMRSTGSTLFALEGWSGLWAFDLPTGRVLWRSGECRP